MADESFEVLIPDVPVANNVIILEGELDILDTSQNMEAPVLAETSLEDFHWTKYAEYLPEDDVAFDVVTAMFDNKSFGWKSRARLVMKIAVQHEFLQRLKEELMTSITKNRKARKAYTRHIDPRQGLRAFLESRDKETLQKLCDEWAVSYKSFMGTNDHTALIEALIDEMV